MYPLNIMDLFNTIAGLSGAGGVILGCGFLIYRCCKGRRFHSKSGCIDIDLSNDVHPEDPEESKEMG